MACFSALLNDFRGRTQTQTNQQQKKYGEPRVPGKSKRDSKGRKVGGRKRKQE